MLDFLPDKGVDELVYVTTPKSRWVLEGGCYPIKQMFEPKVKRAVSGNEQYE